MAVSAEQAKNADSTFRLHCLNRDCFRLPILKYRGYNGFMVSAQNSGTQWVKWMMSNVLASQYNVTPPKYFNNLSSNELIGHPRHQPVHAHIPRIVSTHSIAPYPLEWSWLRKVTPLPRYAVLVRDIRAALVSNYEKWKDTYKVPFSKYVEGDPAGNTYIADVWWYVHFMNRWGAVATRFPEDTLVLTYEGFQSDRVESLRRMFRHFNIDVSETALQAGAAMGSKDVMAKHKDPAVEEKALRADGDGNTTFSADDTEVLMGILDRNLKHDFGYGYFNQPRGYQAADLPQKRAA